MSSLDSFKKTGVYWPDKNTCVIAQKRKADPKIPPGFQIVQRECDKFNRINRFMVKKI